MVRVHPSALIALAVAVAGCAAPPPVDLAAPGEVAIVVEEGITPSATQALTPTPPPAQVATATPTPTAIPPTPTATDVIPFQMREVDVIGGLGVARLQLIDADPLPPLDPLTPQELRLPADRMMPAMPFLVDKGIRYRMIHLGSDYIVFDNPDVLSPHPEHALLVAEAFLHYNTFMSVAVDLSGNTQIYLVNLETPQGIAPVLICYTHLGEGANEAALAQAEANGGRVETVGPVSSMGPNDPNPSDLHIAVIDVAALLESTGQSDLLPALESLFNGEIERVESQYPWLFLSPESVMPALLSVIPPENLALTTTPQP